MDIIYGTRMRQKGQEVFDDGVTGDYVFA